MTETFSPLIPDELEERVRILLESACANDLTLASAESCTGGLLASLLTDVEGVSHAFDRGFIVYTNDAKTALLGVPTPLLDRYGAVSKEVAIAMAEGALAHSPAQVAIAVTGFAGRGDEPGLVHFACARRGRDTRHRVERFGDIGRGPIRVCCLQTGVEMMQEMVR